MTIAEHVFFTIIVLPLSIFLFYLIRQVIKDRYLNLDNVEDILLHFGGVLETEKGLVIRGVYEEIVIEFDGVELSRQRLINPRIVGRIHLESFYKKDVEQFLKKKYKAMKKELKERALCKKAMENYKYSEVRDKYMSRD